MCIAYVAQVLAAGVCLHLEKCFAAAFMAGAGNGSGAGFVHGVLDCLRVLVLNSRCQKLRLAWRVATNPTARSAV
jgi:hypothetical protein